MAQATHDSSTTPLSQLFEDPFLRDAFERAEREDTSDEEPSLGATEAHCNANSYLVRNRTGDQTSWARGADDDRELDASDANDSLECRNCHSSQSMDITKQAVRAAEAHQRFLFTEQKTCIDCHKGIAHKLPDMRSVPDWQ